MRSLALLIALLALLPHSASGQVEGPPAAVETLYADAKAKEKAVQTALADPTASAAVLKAVRTVVADYEAIAHRYPASGYSDDALWFGGWLSIDAFERFGDEQERAAGMRLWRALSTQYPSSKLAKQLPEHLAKAERGRGGRSLDSFRPPTVVLESRDGRGTSERVLNKPAPTPDAPSRPPAPAPAARSTLATLRDIRRTVLPDGVRVTIELDREVAFHDERLSDPARVFVDLSFTSARAELLDRTIRFDGDADLVRQIRIGRHPNTTTRVVLDVAGISAYSVYPLYNPYRLVIECTRAANDRMAVLPARPTLELPARTVGAHFARDLPVPPAILAPPAESEPPLESSPVASGTVSVIPPAKNVGGGFSIARQLGLSVSRIVIDPGHGGHDPGAMGKGVTEAALVLDVALRLETLLAKVPGVEVILTRRTDEFVGLQERTAIANREGADLFLSIHANASGNLQARGVESYFLNFATTSTAAAVAARENAASGQPMAALPDFVKAIALHNKLDESRDFATFVQRAMVERLRSANRGLKDLGVKQAPFVVLIGASMPSVLAEISFLTNVQEVKLLRSSAYRDRIAEALFDAIRKYQGALKTAAKTE